jgi:hypothetical protein
MIRLKKIYFYLLLLLCAPMPVFAARVAHLGKAFDKTGDDLSKTSGLLKIVFWLIALFLAISGVLKLKEYMDAPGKVTLKDPLLRLLAAGFFVALPTLITILLESTVGNAGRVRIGDSVI